MHTAEVIYDDGFPTPLGRQLKGLLNGTVETLGKPGAILRVEWEGLRWRGAAGYARSGQNPRVAAIDDRFRLGSISKMFIAEAALQIIHANRLGLDDTLDGQFPEIPNAAQITIRHLLRHESGLPDFVKLPAIQQSLRETPLRRFSPDELLALALAQDSLFPPGSGCVYSNTNNILLGLLLEKLSGMTLREVLRHHIATPLGLARTDYVESPLSTEADGDDEDFMHGYLEQAPDGLRDVTATDYSVIGAAGAMVSSVDELAVALQAQVTGRFIGTELLRERLAFTPVGVPIPPWWGEQVAVGMGIEAVDHGYIGHYGAFYGYESAAFYHPETHASVVIALNSGFTWGQRVDVAMLAGAVFHILADTWDGCVRLYQRTDKGVFSHRDRQLYRNH